MIELIVNDKNVVASFEIKIFELFSKDATHRIYLLYLDIK